ncbi:MAG: hypothetical protein ACHQUC_02820 [Chlamydiales bacterium]
MVLRNKATQIGLHSVRNILGEQLQLSLFTSHDIDFANEFGIKLSGKLDRFGIDLTEIQSRVMEGILRGFSETQYQGNLAPRKKEILLDATYSDKLPDAYKYILEIPCLKATQTQILTWAEMNKKGISNWARSVEALHELGTKQYCFYYDRLVYDDKGQPMREANGRWKKEEVITVDTLFSIKEIRDEKTGEIKHYEIAPSPIFLDQRETYFMLIPYGWREEVKQLVGNRKASSYTFRFLLFLRYQYELMRRSPRFRSPYQITWNPEEIAIAIKMPDVIYKRKKKRMNEILEDAYLVAKRLGYLSDYERRVYLDTLTLSDDKYFNPKDIELGKAIEAIGDSRHKHEPAAHILFDLFHSNRTSLDQHHQIPAGKIKSAQINDFVDLLNIRPVEDIELIIMWSISHKYWGSKLMTPKALAKEFPSAWAEYVLSKKLNEENTDDRNRTFAKMELAKYENMSLKGGFIYVCGQYVEFANSGQAPSVVVNYDDKDFISKIKQMCLRIGIDIS